MAKAAIVKKSVKAWHPDKNFKNVVIVYRPESASALKMAGEASQWLQAKGLKTYSHPNQKIDGILRLKESKLPDVNLVLVLGGDGTYLQAVRMLGGQKTPILGVNMGSLGFLTDIRKDELYTALQLTLQNKMEMRPRAMVEVKMVRDGKEVKAFKALNDVVIERGPFSHLINIAIYSENHLLNEVKADGLVISTPTGSTAYNLAAGGPILHPDVHSVVVTPVCPHALTHRPIIFPDNQALTFKILRKKQRAFLTIDGQNCGDLKSSDEVIVKRAECDHWMLKKPSQNYFDLLREKLKFGER
jgi:NAD+ kinase